MKNILRAALAVCFLADSVLADPVPHGPGLGWNGWRPYGPNDPANNGEIDYVVVGGGVAGLVMAEQLSRNPSVHVVLLEAGPDGTNEPNINTPAFAAQANVNTRYVWNFTSQPDANLDGRTPALQQGHVWGGGSAVNYMAYSRGAASVFDQWANISGIESLRWSSLFNDFKATSRFTSDPQKFNSYIDESAYGNGPLEVTVGGYTFNFSLKWADALHEVLRLPFVDMSDGKGLGITFGPATIRASNRTRDYALEAYGWQMANRPNVQLIDNAWVSKIGFSGKRATNVTYLSSVDDTVHTICGKEIILTAGAINSPKLLMLSGVGPKDHLESKGIPVIADIPAIGSNLYDHHFSVIEYEMIADVGTSWQLQNNATFATINKEEYAKDGGGFLGVPGGGYALERVPDAVFEAVNDTFHPSLPADRGQLLYQYVPAPFLPNAPNSSIISPFVALVQPEATGYIRLNSSDFRDDPLIYSNYYGSPGDKAAILYGYKKLRQVMQNPSAAQSVVREVFPGANVTSDADLWKAIQQSATTFHHPLGAVALGKVLDEEWRVRGLQGLRVVDSSTFPTPPVAHLQAVVYAYAHHAAGVIRERDGHRWR
ncbi:Glucose-methanol-choline oxidoreductase [Lecanosticta acicola]|uniref:Glucose-methanol-choline oxidoreductase n=1 Tax=Lecanosticta acicola TaxID=111012 RepID=A0AAI9E8D9_9PEZI|nr:Glucose-methanol-choline oxidoreductase [Lecanosticta acicola]